MSHALSMRHPKFDCVGQSLDQQTILASHFMSYGCEPQLLQSQDPSRTAVPGSSWMPLE